MTDEPKGTRVPRLLVAVVAVAASACGSKDSSPDCNGAITGAYSRAMAGYQAVIKQREGSAVTQEQKERFEHGFARSEKLAERQQTLLVQRCTEDKWPAEVLTCLGTISTKNEMFACLNQLPADQQQRARADVESARGSGWRRGMGNGAPPSSRMPPGADDEAPGSAGDAGSATAPAVGSAAAAGSAATGPAAPSAARGSAKQ
jgi:hypothetical protein